MSKSETSSPKYRNKEVLEELYVNKQMSMRVIAEKLGCTTPIIKRWLDRLGIPTRNQAGNGNMPWHDEDQLRQLYDKKDISVRQIAERFGCQDGTIEYWLKKHEIGDREAPSIKYDGNPIRHYWKDGYEVVNAWPEGIRIHRLVAVAEHGFDYVDDWSEYHVHHKNGIKWDNRPSNLSVVTPEEHATIHARDQT